MKKFNVILEFQVTGDEPYDAVLGFIDEFLENKNEFTYIVQDDETKKTYSVDMSEEKGNEVFPYDDYKAFDN